MPIQWTEEMFYQMYSRGYDQAWVSQMEHGSHWGYYGTTFRDLFSRSDFTPATELFIVAVGNGFWYQALNELGGQFVNWDKVYGTDTASWIQTNKSDPLKVDPVFAPKILDLDISSSTILQDLRPLYGGNGKVNGWILTGLVLDSFISDQEILNFGANCENLHSSSGQVCHVIMSEIDWVSLGLPRNPQQTSVDLGLTVAPRTYFSDLLPNHYFFDINGTDSPDGDTFALYTPGSGWSWL